jgi:hypothetical protein
MILTLLVRKHVNLIIYIEVVIGDRNEVENI